MLFVVRKVPQGLVILHDHIRKVAARHIHTELPRIAVEVQPAVASSVHVQIGTQLGIFQLIACTDVDAVRIEVVEVA